MKWTRRIVLAGMAGAIVGLVAFRDIDRRENRRLMQRASAAEQTIKAEIDLAVQGALQAKNQELVTAIEAFHRLRATLELSQQYMDFLRAENRRLTSLTNEMAKYFQVGQ